MFSVGLQQMSAARQRYRDPGGEPTSWSSLITGSRNFAGNQSGAIAWWGAMWLLMGMVVIGGTIDLGRWLNARTDLRSAVDSAVLAAARTLQSNGGDQAEAIQAAKDYLTENTKNIIPLNAQSGQPDDISNLIQFEIGSNGTEISAKGSVDIESRMFAAFKTVFDKYGDASFEQDFSRIPLFRGTGADETSAKLRVGADAKRNIEVSVMLDITGSMGGSKLTDMKAAAKNLVNIIIWDDQSEYTSRVALVPFSEAINVSSLNPNILRSTSSGSDGDNYKNVVTNYRGRKYKFYRQNTCVVERMAPYRYSDDAPVDQNSRFRRQYQRTNCAISQPVVPLTSDKDFLKSRIDSFVASGATAGHLGTEWAWYMLSPNFANAVPSESVPEPYAPVDQPLEERETRKYAVLMTDGTYNVQYCGENGGNSHSGVRDRRSTGSNSRKGSCNAQNGDSAQQARALCEAMKAKGIEVYTVGFQLPSGNAQQTMNECASSADHRYDAGNGEELQQAFNDIALQIAELYLNK